MVQIVAEEGSREEHTREETTAAASPVPVAPPVAIPIMCFCCGQEGYGAVMCPALTSRAAAAAPPPPKPKKPLKKGKEKFRAATQIVKVSPPRK